MSDYVTTEELKEVMKDVLTGIDEMFQRQENRILARIENSIGKQVQMNTERLDALSDRMDALTARMDAMEGHMAAMTERMESMDMRLTSIEADVKEIKETVTRHDDELYILKKAR